MLKISVPASIRG